MDVQSYDFQIKSIGEKPGHLIGYASVFGNEDMQGDICCAGCFKNTLAETGGKVPVLWGHAKGQVVGFSTAAREDGTGLLVEAEMCLTSSVGADAYETVKMGAKLGQPFGLSIGYQIRPNGSKMQGQVRLLTDVTLLEWSLAAVPANQLARVRAVKSVDGMTPQDWDRHFRENGFSKKDSERLVYVMRKGLSNGADDPDAEFINGLMEFLQEHNNCRGRKS